MRRTLSSGLTFFYKFIFTSFWIGMFGLGTATMFLTQDGSSNADAVVSSRWTFLTVWIVGSAAVYWFCGRLKRVILTDNSFLISNYRTEIEIPLRHVDSVSGSLLIQPQLVWLRFRRPTEFGSKIVFMPGIRFSLGFTRHPIVKELESILSDPRIHE